MNTLEILRKSPDIVEINEAILTPEILEKIGPEFSPLALENAKKIKVYKMIYLSEGKKIVGFIVEPVASVSNNEKLPCIIYNRGGSYEFGSIVIGRLYLDLAQFALHGYIMICTQYSGNAGSEGKDEFGGEDIMDV